MQLHTTRLLIREISWHDLDTIHELHSLPETDKFNTLGIPATIETTRSIVSEWLTAQNQEPRTNYVFGIEQNNEKEFIGLIALSLGKQNFYSAEVWYKIHLAHWGKGYATEALRRLIQFGFLQLKLHRIEAGCAVENAASSKVLEKVGMVKEGRKRKNLPIRGEWKDNYFYAILEEDFLIK